MAGLTFEQLQGMGAKPVQPTGLTLQQIIAKQSQPTPTPQQPETRGLENSPSLRPAFNTIGGAIGSLFNTTKENMANQQKQSFNAIGSDISGGAESFSKAGTAISKGDIVEGAKQSVKGSVQAGLGTTADAINYFFAPLTGAIKTVTDTVSGNTPESNGVGLSDIPAVQQFANSKAGDKLQEVKNTLQQVADAHPTIAKALNDAFIVASTAVGGPKVPEAGSILGEGITKDMATVGAEASNIASDVSQLGTITKEKVSSMLPESKPPVLDESSILDRYNKSIKPSVSGKGTASKIADSNARVVDGLKAISENKANLEFTDAEGNVIKGESPKSVGQLSEAIDQTKKSIYEKYDALATQAGEKGVRVNGRQVAMELDPVITNKALQITNPDAIAYAKATQERLWKNGELDAKTAQEVIQNYNAELKSFYRNPVYGMSSKVQIDAMVANQIRKALDDGITNATGEQYQALKNQYGALSSMEKDVAKRASTLSKGAPSGIVNTLTNITSGAELVNGLITMSPAKIMTSGAMKAMQLYMKYLNNPDVGIQKIFSEMDATTPKPTEVTPPQGQEKISSDKPTTFTPKSQTGKLITSAVEKYKNIPSKQGGFVKIGEKTYAEIPEATKKEMIQVIDYLRLKIPSPGIEKTLDNLAKKYNINQDLSSSKISNYFEKLIENTKTRNK